MRPQVTLHPHWFFRGVQGVSACALPKSSSAQLKSLANETCWLGTCQTGQRLVTQIVDQACMFAGAALACLRQRTSRVDKKVWKWALESSFCSTSWNWTFEMGGKKVACGSSRHVSHYFEKMKLGKESPQSAVSKLSAQVMSASLRSKVARTCKTALSCWSSGALNQLANVGKERGNTNAEAAKECEGLTGKLRLETVWERCQMRKVLTGTPMWGLCALILHTWGVYSQ